MPPPKTTKAGPAQSGPVEKITTATKPQDLRQSDTAPRVGATFLPPNARRTLGALIVRGCVYCGAGHLHRGGGGLRQAGCGKGSYVIVPATERRAVA